MFILMGVDVSSRSACGRDCRTSFSTSEAMVLSRKCIRCCSANGGGSKLSVGLMSVKNAYVSTVKFHEFSRVELFAEQAESVLIISHSKILPPIANLTSMK